MRVPIPASQVGTGAYDLFCLPTKRLTRSPISSRPATTESVMTTIIRVFFSFFTCSISLSISSSLGSSVSSWLDVDLSESESADWIPNAVTPWPGNKGGPSASISQMVSSPTGSYKKNPESETVRRNNRVKLTVPLTKNLSAIPAVQRDFCARLKWPNPSCSMRMALSPSISATASASLKGVAGSALLPMIKIGFAKV